MVQIKPINPLKVIDWLVAGWRHRSMRVALQYCSGKCGTSSVLANRQWSVRLCTPAEAI